MRFAFTGDIRINGDDQRNPSIKSGKTNNINYMRFGVGVANQRNNSAWTDCFGMDNATIMTMDTDGNGIEIDKDNRFDKDIVSKVASYRKNVINIIDDRKEFISTYDAIKYLSDNIDVFKHGKFTVTGNVDMNVYNGNVNRRFTIQNIYAASDDAKAQLKITDTFFFCKDSFDTSEWASEHKLYIDGWSYAFFDKKTLGASKGKNMYTPLQLVFDCGKIDWDNEKHVKLVNYKLKQIGCSLEDGKIKVGLKKNVYKIPVVIAYINGAQEEEFNESMLSANQKEAIELGLKTIDDFRPSGGVYGEKITMYKLTDFDLRGDYENGCVDTEMSVSKLEEEEFKVAKTETLEDLEEEIKEAAVEENDDDDSDDDLFN